MNEEQKYEIMDKAWGLATARWGNGIQSREGTAEFIPTNELDEWQELSDYLETLMENKGE